MRIAREKQKSVVLEDVEDMRKRMKGLRKLSQRGGRSPKEGRRKPQRKSEGQRCHQLLG